MAISLSAEQKNISKIFINEDLFIIPSYQRPYSWEFDECNQLYVDMITAFDRDESYFLGNIILAKSLNTAEKDKHQIIDGQQRSVTIWLIIKVMSVLFPDISRLKRLIAIESWNSDEEWTPRIKSEIIENNDNNDLKEVFNWDKNKFDSELARVTNNKGSINEKKIEGRIQTNSLYFYQWFLNLQNANSDYLKRFIRYFIEDITLLPIELSGNNITDSVNQALSIFETINNRGRDLEDADIFKAMLYSNALKKENQNIFMKSWAILKDEARDLSLNIDDLFRYYSHVIRAEQGTVGNEIKLRKFFVEESRSPFKTKSVDLVLDDLSKIAEVLKLYESKKNSSTQLGKWLQIIDAYTNIYPKYAIIVYWFYRVGEIENDDKEFIRFIQSLVRYVYSKGTTTTVKFEIYNIIHKVFRGEKVDDYLDPDFVLDSFDRMGRLKKGFVLIAQYARPNTVAIPFYKLDRYITARDAVEMEKFSDFDINSLGNLFINERIINLDYTLQEFVRKEENDKRKTIENFFNSANTQDEKTIH